MTDAAIVVTADSLTAFAVRVFTAAGVADDDARVWADALIWANLRGVDSHGVLRLPRYVDVLRSGDVNPRPRITIERRDGAMAVIDCDSAPGPVAMTHAMDTAIERARAAHVGWCLARHVTHSGAIGYYAQMAARRGMAGIVMIASRPFMAYHGARVRAVSSNPIAIAVPGGAHPPLVLDMSTSTVSMGKILEARDAGEAIPAGWGLDAEGRPTTDPNKVGMLTPLGGAKGSGLSLLLECLVSLFVASPMLAPPAGAGASGMHQNGLAAAIDIAAFTDLAGYREQVDRLAAAIKGLPRAEGVDALYAPGERGDAEMAERRASGIPLPRGTWDRLAAVARELGVPMPERN